MPSPRDAAEAKRLFDLVISSHDWGDFSYQVGWPLRPPPVLGPEASKAIAIHLFLQEAFHRPVAALDVSKLDAIRESPLDMEAAVLKYELLVLKKDPRAKALRDVLLRAHPGLRHRIEKADNEAGTLGHGYRP
jgi:hypothetical protein